MHSFRMRLELGFPSESSTTQLAREIRIQMAHQVLGETRFGFDHPLAYVTLKTFIRQVHPVDMLHQICPVAELFAANAAQLGFALTILKLRRACVVLFHVLQVVHVHLVVFSANIALERVHLAPGDVIHFLPGSLGVAEKMRLGSQFLAERCFAARALSVPPTIVCLHVLKQVALHLEGGAADLTLGGHKVGMSSLVFHQCPFV